MNCFANPPDGYCLLKGDQWTWHCPKDKGLVCCSWLLGKASIWRDREDSENCKWLQRCFWDFTQKLGEMIPNLDEHMLGVAPSQDASDHQNYSIFRFGVSYPNLHLPLESCEAHPKHMFQWGSPLLPASWGSSVNARSFGCIEENPESTSWWKKRHIFANQSNQPPLPWKSKTKQSGWSLGWSMDSGFPILPMGKIWSAWTPRVWFFQKGLSNFRTKKKRFDRKNPWLDVGHVTSRFSGLHQDVPGRVCDRINGELGSMAYFTYL